MTSAPSLSDFGAHIPASFRSMLAGRTPEGGPDGDTWLAALPRIVRELTAQWDLRPTGPVRHGMAAVVIPVTSAIHGPAVLKVSWPHPEARHEHLALREWDGQGAVRLLAADPHRYAMLLEPLDAGRELSHEDVGTSCAVIGNLLRRLDRPALPQIARVSMESIHWASQVRDSGTHFLPRRITDRAAAIFIELGSADGADARLVHTDLHDMNVLGAEREPWLAIDPKPLAATPEFAIAPLLWNREHDAAAAHSVRGHLRWRVEIACDAGVLDPDTAMLWSLARCALNVAWAVEDGEAPDSSSVSWMITCCKAMLD